MCEVENRVENQATADHGTLCASYIGSGRTQQAVARLRFFAHANSAKFAHCAWKGLHEHRTARLCKDADCNCRALPSCCFCCVMQHRHSYCPAKMSPRRVYALAVKQDAQLTESTWKHRRAGLGGPSQVEIHHLSSAARALPVTRHDITASCCAPRWAGALSRPALHADSLSFVVFLDVSGTLGLVSPSGFHTQPC
jgi:hypothetical protein